MAKGGAGALFRAAPLPTRSHPGPRLRGGAAEGWATQGWATQGWATLHGFVPAAPATDDPRRRRARDRLVAAVPAKPPAYLTGEGAALIHADLLIDRYGRGPGAFDAAVAGLARWLLATQGSRALARAVERVRLAAPHDRAANAVRTWSESFFFAALAGHTGAESGAFVGCRNISVRFTGAVARAEAFRP